MYETHTSARFFSIILKWFGPQQIAGNKFPARASPRPSPRRGRGVGKQTPTSGWGKTKKAIDKKKVEKSSLQDIFFHKTLTAFRR